jgi:hypothetical protein
VTAWLARLALRSKIRRLERRIDRGRFDYRLSLQLDALRVALEALNA